MTSQAVLVLGAYANRDLTEVLLSIGFVPLVRETIECSLDKLRHEQFMAILVDRKFAQADVLEFILNVRDINEKIPVIVLGRSEDGAIDKTLMSQNHTMILDGEVENSDRLTEDLERILSVGVKRNG